MSRQTARRTLLGGLAALGAPAASALQIDAPATSPDAELIRLGALFTEAWRRSRAAHEASDREAPGCDGLLTAEADALHEKVAELVLLIEPCDALTIDGVLVKMRALQWCRGDQPGVYSDPVLCVEDLRGGGQTTDMRLIRAVLDELRRMAGAAS